MLLSWTRIWRVPGDIENHPDAQPLHSLVAYVLMPQFRRPISFNDLHVPSSPALPSDAAGADIGIAFHHLAGHRALHHRLNAIHQDVVLRGGHFHVTREPLVTSTTTRLVAFECAAAGSRSSRRRKCGARNPCGVARTGRALAGDTPGPRQRAVPPDENTVRMSLAALRTAWCANVLRGDRAHAAHAVRSRGEG